MINVEILSPTTTITPSSSFSVPSQIQAQTLFSFLKSANSCISFNALYDSIFEHLNKVFEIDFSIVIVSYQIIYSKKYSKNTPFLSEEEINMLEKESKLQKLVFTKNENNHYFLYIPIQKSNQLLNIFVCLSQDSYQNIDNQTISFLDCFYQMILSALVRLDKQENDIKFKTIFESFQDIYFQATPNGIITSISPSVKAILEYDPKELVNKAIHSFLISKEKLENLLFILKERKKIKNYEIHVLSKLGHSKTLLCNFQVLEDKTNKNILAIEGIAREINESKKVSQEVQKTKQNIERILESKKQFLADMGHEIRTPMNGIIGMIDLLRTTQLNEEQNNYLDTIEASSNDLLTILNNVLDLSKMEANKMLLKPEVFELKSVLEQFLLLFTKEIRQKSLQLSVKVTDKTPRKIIADKSRLLQIFGSLISNAIKYNVQNGKISISLDTLKEEDGKLLLRGEVKDTGIGISEENQEFLFDSFSKLQHHYQKIVSGTGLGLTIAKHLAEIMGGTMQVWSKEKEGSTFYFSFEALRSTENNREDELISENNSEIQSELASQKTTTQIQLDWENSFINNPLILVVDDNTTNLTVAKKILEKSGCQIITAVNGKEAIHKIKNNQFELVYMDIQMPEMDGVTATRFIKRLKISVPPIIALTAFTVADEKERFISAGMDDYLPKPVKAETLIQKTKQWIDIKFHNLDDENSKENRAKKSQESINKANLASQSSTESLKYLPIVNTQTAQQLQKWGGQELVDESYELFETETTGLLIEAIMAFNKNDRQTLKLHVHTIKGSAATLGIDRMATIATEIDAMLKDDIDADVAEQMQAFEHSFEEYRLNYRIILNL
ncbi:response regulator (plasmid) [Bernardetia sp. Wsw4-3y2]|uniref:response regulator n=1 Tax=Bernardetia sp. Wsw4-3y2 TaxID=3127471 RepID=UPI0030D226D6